MCEQGRDREREGSCERERERERERILSRDLTNCEIMT